MTQQLIIKDLACGHGGRALFPGFSLALRSGETARILGENGVGKSTFLRTVAGLALPLSGQVCWQDSTASEPPRLVDALCFIDHDNALNEALTPLENLRLLARVAGRAVADRQIRDTLAGLGLNHIIHRLSGQLSSGQKRRVSLARLWLTDAPLWLLDEPAAALDLDARQALAARMRAHAAAGGIVIYTTHEALDVPAAREVRLTDAC